MEETLILYASPDHLDSMLVLAMFITKQYPSISVVVLSTAAAAAVPPSVTYRRLPTPALPQNTTSNYAELLFEIARLNNPNIREALHEISQKSKIKAFIIDIVCNPAFEVSSSLSIPTYFYMITGAFILCVLLYRPTLHGTIPENIEDSNEFVEIPGCPPIYSSDFSKIQYFRQSNIHKQVQDALINMHKSAGIIVNTFYALECRAMEAIANGLCTPHARTPPVYSLGPLIAKKKGIRADHECLRWLDLQPRKSVIFLCFGRKGVFSAEQLTQMAIGLENSGHRFLWTIRSLVTGEEPSLDALLPEGFLERTKEKGLVLKSWAPQVEVLSHGSVGGFVTHCGQSSILEAVSFGVPMICWPLYAEQRLNRVFLVEEMKVALPLEEMEDGFVTAVELEKRVRWLMESKTRKEVRRRVTEMKHAAAAAVRKDGSSRVALDKFMETVAFNRY